MKSKTNFLLFTLLTLIAIPSFSSLNSQDRSRYGVFGHFNINQHSSDFLGNQLPFPSCCPRFENGSGTGFSLGLLYELPLAKNLLGSVRAGYFGLNGEMIDEEPTVVYDYENNLETNGIFEHHLHSYIGVIALEPGINYRLFDEFFVNLGLNVGLFQMTKKYDHKEVIKSPTTGVFENNSRERLVFVDQEIQNSNSILFSMYGGLSYEIGLDKNRQWLLAPEVFYNLMLNDIVNQDNFKWKVNTLRLGLALKYSPIDELTPTFGLSGDILASALDPKGNESSIVTFQVEEFLSTNIKPLLTYVFFDDNSSEIPERYHRLNKNSISAFDIDKLYALNNLETYYHVLNIIGKRMTQNPDAKIALDGCNSNDGKEKNNLTLSQKRAEAIRDYFINVWGIASDRIIVEKRNLPQEPTNINEADGIQENRRVEITSNKWEIIAPITAKDTFRTSTPPKVRFKPSYQSEAGLFDWQINAMQDGKALKTFSGKSDMPEFLDWILNNEENNIPTTNDELEYDIELSDVKGQTFKSKTKSIPVEQVTIQKKKREKLQDKYIDRFSLILFSYDESNLSMYNNRMIDVIKSTLKPKSKLIITGHTDRLGESTYNKRLSEQRANTVGKSINFANSEVFSYGENEQIYDNNLPEARFYSRRVDIIIETPIED